MTLFTGILDPDALRTKSILEGSRKLAPDLPWLKHTDTHLGRLFLSLDSAPLTPYSTYQDAAGRSVFVLGDILHQTESDNAAWLSKQCLEHGPEMLGRQNGYYLAGMIDEHDAIYLAADQLGLVPLYYWTGPEHFCFSTSPNAFLSHPGFTVKPDLMGIAGILLTTHATGNRTTWQDVKRLPPGHLLRWRKGEGVRLSDVNSLKVHDSYFGWPQSRCQNLIQNSFNEAVQRLDKLGETSVLPVRRPRLASCGRLPALARALQSARRHARRVRRLRNAVRAPGCSKPGLAFPSCSGEAGCLPCLGTHSGKTGRHADQLRRIHVVAGNRCRT